MIKRVAVAVARWLTKDGNAPIILDPPHLPIVRDVAPDQVLPLAVPRRSFAPHATCPQPLNRRVADANRVECGIVRDDVGIGIGDRLRKIARRIRDDARWVGGFLWALSASELRSEYRNACCTDLREDFS